MRRSSERAADSAEKTVRDIRRATRRRRGLITSPAFILMKAADRFANPTTAPNQLWQTDFTYRAPRLGWSGVHMTGMH
jgi:transposase InsO family protein